MTLITSILSNFYEILFSYCNITLLSKAYIKPSKSTVAHYKIKDMPSIQVHYGGDVLDIDKTQVHNLDSLVQKVEKHFKAEGLRPRFTYKNDDCEVFFIRNDVDLIRAVQTLPKVIIAVCEATDKIYQQFCNLDSDWLEEKKNSQIMVSSAPSGPSIEISQEIIKEIELNAPTRQWHSEDIATSFLMSFYRIEAEKQGIPAEKMDNTLSKLDRWRQNYAKKDKNVPRLGLPWKLRNRKAKNTNVSYLFSNSRKLNPPMVGAALPGQPALAVEQTLPAGQNTSAIKFAFWDKIQDFISGGSKSDPKALTDFLRNYSDLDTKFVTKVAEAYQSYKNNPVNFPPKSNDSSVFEFEDNAVVGILGDWGTGLQDATDILTHLVKQEKATIILHNGDVYYAGFPDEFNKINKQVNDIQATHPNVKYFAIPGNHDSYTWGGPFYDHLKANNSGQEFGFFCLRNKSKTVQFIGLNTGFHDNDPSMSIPLFKDFFEGTYIDDKELIWALDKINNFEGKTILITHHPLFSTFEETIGTKTDVGYTNPQVNPNLAKGLFEALPKVTCWLWGHEHRFSTYKPNSFAVNRSVMIGNSAFQNNQNDYYNVKFPSGDITQTKYHPAKGGSISDKGWINHTAISLRNFKKGENIHANYVYMTSSYTQKSELVKTEKDEYADPVRSLAQLKAPYQLLEESGLSLAVDERVWLDSNPTDIQFISSNDSSKGGAVQLNQPVYIRAVGTEKYLVVQGNQVSFSELGGDKSRFEWVLIRPNELKAVKVGDVFTLKNISSKKAIGRQFASYQKELRLTTNSTSRFQIYQRNK